MPTAGCEASSSPTAPEDLASSFRSKVGPIRMPIEVSEARRRASSNELPTVRHGGCEGIAERRNHWRDRVGVIKERSVRY